MSKASTARTRRPIRPLTKGQTESLSEILAPLEPTMERLELFFKTQWESFEPGINSCVEYVSGSKGKRLRPALCILSANAQRTEAPGTAEEDLLKMCAVVELVHIATLVHDDILDGALLRRNRATANAKWGQEISVLLGDTLFSQALVIAASHKNPLIGRCVAEATRTVCTGEILQIQRRFDLKLDQADYLRVIEMKTGELFAASCELGARQAQAPEAVVHSLSHFGRTFGTAYQIYDDCLDLVGTENEMGKSLGTDLQKGKLTLPVILLLQKVKESEASLISSILLNEHSNSQAMLLDFIQRYGTLRESACKAVSLLSESIGHLKPLAESESRQCLIRLASSLSRRLEALA